MESITALWRALRAAVASRADLVTENLALQHHVLVLQRSVKRPTLRNYYHTVRPHVSLERNAPIPRPAQGPSEGQVIAMPHVGGLYHGYCRAA